MMSLLSPYLGILWRISLATFILTIIAISKFAIAPSLQQLNWPGNQVSHSYLMQFGLKLWIA